MPRSGYRNSNTNPNLILIVCVVAGTTVVFSVTFVSLYLLRRRQRTKKHFQEACMRDPGLTWDEYERRGRLTRSRLLFEEEIQRNIMIRKSQQSRTSDYNDIAVVEETQPTCSRSRTWHGRSRSKERDVEVGKPISRDTVLDWGSAEASLERVRQLLHGKRSSSPVGHGPLRGEGCENALRRLPTLRPKTPPLLSHPLFRNGVAHMHTRSRHMSLPVELIRAKMEPVVVEQHRGGAHISDTWKVHD